MELNTIPGQQASTIPERQSRMLTGCCWCAIFTLLLWEGHYLSSLAQAVDNLLTCIHADVGYQLSFQPHLRFCRLERYSQVFNRLHVITISPHFSEEAWTGIRIFADISFLQLACLDAKTFWNALHPDLLWEIGTCDHEALANSKSTSGGRQVGDSGQSCSSSSMAVCGGTSKS